MSREKNTILMGTFLKNTRVPRKVMREIVEIFDVNKIFVFEVKDENDETSFLITFNVDRNDSDRLDMFRERFKNTVQLHRNKDSNTLYTINSLNEVVLQQNGERDSSFKVDWKPFENTCLVLSKEKTLRMLKTKLYDVVEL